MVACRWYAATTCTMSMTCGRGNSSYMLAASTFELLTLAVSRSIRVRQCGPFDLAVQKRGQPLPSQIRLLVGAPEIFEASGPVEAYAAELASADELYRREDLTAPNPVWYANGQAEGIRRRSDRQPCKAIKRHNDHLYQTAPTERSHLDT